MTKRSRGRPPHPDTLTPAEWRVLDLVRHGLTRRQVAHLRGTGEDAVKYHLANIAGKLGVPGIRELRRWPGYPATSPARTRKEPTMRSEDLRLGLIGQVSLSVRDTARAERFYGETLGLPHHFTFGDLAFFDVWHGIPFKGFDAEDFRVQRHYDETWVASPLLRDLYVDRFSFEPERVVPTGYARTDRLVRRDDDLAVRPAAAQEVRGVAARPVQGDAAVARGAEFPGEGLPAAAFAGLVIIEA